MWLKEFFKKPYGIGSAPNIYMLSPARFLKYARMIVCEPKYVAARLKVMAFQMRRPDAPWLTQEVVEFLDGFLKPDMKGFEWGAGRSTRWLAKRLKSLVSVEDNAGWYERVKGEVAALAVDCRLASGGCAAYAGQIAEFPDGSFDLVLIDGSCRNQCIAAAAAKVRIGGVIVLDNADEGYRTEPLAAAFDYRPTSNGVWRTDLFIRRR